MLPEGFPLGPYRTRHVVGKGSSEVYLAEDPRIPREVAIKVMQTQQTQFANTEMLKDAVNDFQREAQMVSKLGGHVHILPLLDYGQETINGTIYTYLVMPYQQEGTLADWLQKHARHGSSVLPPLEVCKILNIAADALQYAHDHGVVHRDVKLSNFLMGNKTTNLGDPSLLLADFGIARQLQYTHTTQAIGTPLYMAPEQWKGHPVFATDQYALAILAFFLLTGAYPFEGNLPILAKAHAEQKPPCPSKLNTQLSPAIDSVLLHALEKKPQKRFPSVTEFAAAFEEAANKDKQELSQQATIPKQQNPPKVHRPTFRLPLMIILVLLVLVFSATAGGTLFYLQQRDTANRYATATATTLQKTAVSENNATRTTQANATATAQANATATARANATATAGAKNPPPTTYPFAPYSQRVLNEQFMQDYATNNYPGNWQNQKNASFACQFTPEGYNVIDNTKGQPHTCFNETLSYTDFTYQANLLIAQGDCAGILFRSNGSTNYYVFDICRDTTFSFYPVENNQPLQQQADNGTSQNIRTGPHDINVIAVVAHGNHLQFFVNSKKAIFSTPDNTFTSGGIGVIALDKNTPTSVFFKIVEVFTL